MQSICLVTPTHSRDLEQFSLLRRSINAFAPDYPHLAVVNTEDLPEFRNRFGSERNLEIVPSSDLLPKFLEFRGVSRIHRRRYLRGVRDRYTPIQNVGAAQPILTPSAFGSAGRTRRNRRIFPRARCRYFPSEC
jgi:hypothetical protein